LSRPALVGPFTAPPPPPPPPPLAAGLSYLPLGVYPRSQEPSGPRCTKPTFSLLKFYLSLRVSLA